MAKTVAELDIKIDGDADGLTRELKRAQKNTRDFGDGMRDALAVGANLALVTQGAMAVAGAMLDSATAVKQFVADTTALVDTEVKLARTLDITHAELAQLDIVAARSGASIERLSDGMKLLQRNIGEALQGNVKLNAAFESLGLSAEDLAAMRLPDALDMTAKQLQQVESNSERAALSMQIFGRAGFDLQNTFQALADGALTDATEKAALFNKELSLSQQQRFELLQDEMDETRDAIEGASQQMAILLSPAVLKSAETMQWIFAGLGDRISNIAWNLGIAREELEQWRDLGDGIQVLVDPADVATEFGENEVRLAGMSAESIVAEVLKELEGANKEFADTERAAFESIAKAGMEAASFWDKQHAERMRQIRDEEKAAQRAADAQRRAAESAIKDQERLDEMLQDNLEALNRPLERGSFGEAEAMMLVAGGGVGVLPEENPVPFMQEPAQEMPAVAAADNFGNEVEAQRIADLKKSNKTIADNTGDALTYLETISQNTTTVINEVTI